VDPTDTTTWELDLVAIDHARRVECFVRIDPDHH
jgi:hypothetical protein